MDNINGVRMNPDLSWGAVEMENAMQVENFHSSDSHRWSECMDLDDQDMHAQVATWDVSNVPGILGGRPCVG